MPRKPLDRHEREDGEHRARAGGPGPSAGSGEGGISSSQLKWTPGVHAHAVAGAGVRERIIDRDDPGR
jgi:hypothetical protein